jgi:hypothetical protein
MRGSKLKNPCPGHCRKGATGLNHVGSYVRVAKINCQVPSQEL